MFWLNLTSFGLLVGAGGQALLLMCVLPRVPQWIVWMPLLAPWVTVYFVSFCRQPPCGPRVFRSVLIFAMCWYSVATLTAQSLYLLIRPSSHFSFKLAHLLMYLGALTFLVLLRFCATLRRLEKTPSEGVGATGET
jgi:hypothetical protein